MKKFGKRGFVAIASLVAALSVSAIVPAFANAAEESKIPAVKGFDVESVEVLGANEALSKWMYYFYNDKDAAGKERGWSYESENLHVLATTEGRTGNALLMRRDKADGELVMYSYAFDVKPDQNYVIGAYLKSICAQTADKRFISKSKSRTPTEALRTTKIRRFTPFREEETIGRKLRFHIKRLLPPKRSFLKSARKAWATSTSTTLPSELPRRLSIPTRLK